MSDDKRPTPDRAEEGAFFPSPYSLSQFVAPKTNLSGADYTPYTGGRWKILVVGADERYLPMDNGTLFSTGNHPVETLLPMYHLDKAGFAFDIATLSGNMVKFEFWAMPEKDTEVKDFYAKLQGQFRQPLKLADVVKNALGENSDYIGVFIPGGHGALNGLAESEDMKALLEWTAAQNKFVISLCHGPAAFISLGQNSPYAGYQITAFPDAIDAQLPDSGYTPGHLTWKFGEKLKANGFEILNNDMTGAVHQDRKMLTGDSPLAANALGQMAAKALLAEAAQK